MARRRSIPIPTGWLALVVALLALPVALVQAERWVVVLIALVALVVVATGPR